MFPKHQPKLVSSHELMRDDEDDDPFDADDGHRPTPRKGAKVAGGFKGPVPPALMQSMRARRSRSDQS